MVSTVPQVYLWDHQEWSAPRSPLLICQVNLKCLCSNSRMKKRSQLEVKFWAYPLQFSQWHKVKTGEGVTAWPLKLTLTLKLKITNSLKCVIHVDWLNVIVCVCELQKKVLEFLSVHCIINSGYYRFFFLYLQSRHGKTGFRSAVMYLTSWGHKVRP